MPDGYRAELRAGKIQIPLVSSVIDWIPISSESPFTNQAMHYVDGEPIATSNFSLAAKFTIRHFFGYLSGLPNIAALHNIELNEAD